MVNIEAPFWNRPLSVLEGEQQGSPLGLTSEEARRRLESVGPNHAPTRAVQPAVLQFLARFKRPLVLLSVTLDFVQERRADKAVDALRRSIAVHALALRDEFATRVAVNTLVPGDTITLAADDLIPADGGVLEVKDLFVSQAALTGEPPCSPIEPVQFPNSASRGCLSCPHSADLYQVALGLIRLWMTSKAHWLVAHREGLVYDEYAA